MSTITAKIFGDFTSMTVSQVIAQVLGIIGIAVFLLCFQFKEMKTARKIKMAVDVSETLAFCSVIIAMIRHGGRKNVTKSQK